MRIAQDSPSAVAAKKIFSITHQIVAKGFNFETYSPFNSFDLIVDDEFYIVQGIINGLDQSDLGIHHIFPAYSMEQAKKIILREPIDIMITDIEMPKGSGLSLIDWTIKNGYSILTLILSGHQRFDYAQKALTMQCFNYILKPINMSVLKKELKRAVLTLTEKRNANVYVETAVPDSNEFIEKIRSFIMENLHSPELDRNRIAEYVHMNPDYLSTLFRTKFNQNLVSYITSAKIDRAKELLANTSLSLNEISERTGFSTSSYFHKQFKKTTGMTPSQYAAQKHI